MCDAMSLFSAGMDLTAGIAEAKQAKAKATLEDGQLQAMKVFAMAAGSAQEAELHATYAEHMRGNIAAAAISGFDMASFTPIMEGNAKDEQKNLATIGRNVQLEMFNYDMQRRMVKTDAQMAGEAALWGGFTSAFSAVYDAEKSFEQTDTTGSRWGALKKSFLTEKY